MKLQQALACWEHSLDGMNQEALIDCAHTLGVEVKRLQAVFQSLCDVWEPVDAYVRGHSETKLGESVVGRTLGMLQERDRLVSAAVKAPVAFWWIGADGEPYGGPYRGTPSDAAVENARTAGCEPQFLYSTPVAAPVVPAVITTTPFLPDADTRRNDAEFSAQPAATAPSVEYVPIETGSHAEAGGRHPNDKTTFDENCQRALIDRGDDRGQGLCAYWKWGFREGWAACSSKSTPEAAPSVPEDTAILDWLELQCVEVRYPLAYGSRAGFFSTPADEEGVINRNDLRQKVRALLQPPKPTGG